jgi:hypothetical protein
LVILALDPDSELETDSETDSHLESDLHLSQSMDPDPHLMNADPKHWYF